MKNFKVKCVKSAIIFTYGKIYEVKDGYLTDDHGDVYGKGLYNDKPFVNVDEINHEFGSKFEIFEEEKKTPFQYMLDYYNIKVGEVFKINGEKVYFDENKMLKKENGRSAYLYISLLDENSKVEKIPWKPKYGDTVWMIFSDGGVYECFFSKSSPSNIALLKLGWLFQTKEEAEANKERVLAEMKEVLE